MRRFLIAIVGALVLAPSASGAPLLGVIGDADRFRSLTGQRSDVRLVILSWGQGHTYGKRFAAWFPQLGSIPMIGFGTESVLGREKITPRGIAQGKGDSYLIGLNRAAAAWGKPLYVRPLAEMNGYWNSWCAYNANGTRRDAAHSTASYRNAFRRISIILHGGPRDVVNAKLARWGLPGIGTDLPEIPYPQMRVVWNPQGYGSPNVPGNSARAYYPGDRYVDVVANDLYDIRGKAEWAANEALYKAHPNKPYAMGEWGLWGIDDPAFVRRMASWVRTHRRVQVIIYFKSQNGSIFDLSSKPGSRAAYRRYITPLGR